MDVAMVEIVGIVLVLVYVEHDQDIRAISLRRASKQERKYYANLQQDYCERVKREAAADALIAQEPGALYDPNDPAAVDAFFEQATVRRRG